MSRIFRSLGLAIVSAMVVAGAASAQSTTPAKASSSMKSSKASAGSHSLKGTLEKFDASSRMITVQTSKGAETLALGAGAHIMQGSKMVAADDLASHTGSKVDVKYTESNGQKTAQDVRLTASPSAKKKGY